MTTLESVERPMVRGSTPRAISVPPLTPEVMISLWALLVVARGCTPALEPSSGVNTGTFDCGAGVTGCGSLGGFAVAAAPTMRPVKPAGAAEGAWGWAADAAAAPGAPLAAAAPAAAPAPA